MKRLWALPRAALRASSPIKKDGPAKDSPAKDNPAKDSPAKRISAAVSKNRPARVAVSRDRVNGTPARARTKAAPVAVVKIFVPPEAVVVREAATPNR